MMIDTDVYVYVRTAFVRIPTTNTLAERYWYILICP